MVDEFLALKLIWAIAVTGLVASIGFDRPSWCRSYTTATRYRVALVTYVLLQVLAMLLLYLLLRQAIIDAGAMGAIQGLVRPSTPVWVALGATLVLFAIPSIESPTRRLLQTLAGVPDRGLGLAQLLRDAELHADEAVLTEARFILQRRGIEVERDWLPLAQPAQQILLDATVLYIALRNWQADPKYRRYADDAKNDFDLFRQRFDRLSLRVSRVFESIEHLGQIKRLVSAPADRQGAVDDEVDTLIRKLVSDMLADICADISVYYSDACLLMARGIMTTERTAKARKAAVSRLGFRLRSEPAPASYSALALAALLLYVGVGLFFALIDPDPPKPQTDELREIGRPALALIITLTQLGALVIAVVPKMRWGFANSGLQQRTPPGFVLAAGALAVLYAIVLNLVAGGLLIGGWTGGVMRLTAAAPFLATAFATAATTAWLVQDHRWRRVRSPRVRRVLDAATMGLIWLATSVIGTYLKARWFATAYGPADALIAMAVGLLLGSLIGYIVPGSFRIEALTRSTPPHPVHPPAQHKAVHSEVAPQRAAA